MIAAKAAAGLIKLDPELAIERLKGEFFDDSLPAAERKRLRARAGAAQRDRRAQAERNQARDRAAAGADGARRLVALEGAIGRGEAGEQAIAEAADILDDPTRAKLHEMLKARRGAARTRRGTGASRRSLRCSPGAPRPPATAKETENRTAAAGTGTKTCTQAPRDGARR